MCLPSDAILQHLPSYLGFSYLERASGPFTSWQIDGETVETVRDFILGGSKIAADGESVQFSHSVVSDSLLPHELQQARPPCPSPTAGVYPNSYPLSR